MRTRALAQIRLLGALALFLAISAASVWYLMSGMPASEPAAPRSPAGQAAEDPDLFYDKIGSSAVKTTPMQAGRQVPSSGYTLEFRMTRDRSEAEKTIDALRDKGVDAYFTPLSRKGAVVYRIRHGLYTTPQEASKMKLSLKKTKDLDARVVRLQ